MKSISLNSKFPWHWQTTNLQNSITFNLTLLNIIYTDWKINISRLFIFRTLRLVLVMFIAITGA